MKNVKSQLQFATLLVCTLVLRTAAYGQITPSGDAYTNTATPTTNFGTKPVLDVESASQTSYIQFDLSSIPSGYSGASIAKATLRLYVNAVTTAGSFNVDFVNGTWSEKTITANLAPALGTTIVSSVPLTSTNVHDYVLIDVTPAVVAWLDGTEPNDGIALVANSPLNASFDSKENTANSQPAELDIVFAGGGTLTGVTTAGGSGLTGGGTSGTLNLSLTNACSANQVLQWNGSVWQCAAVGAGTITGVNAGAGLTGGGTSGTITLNVDTTKVPQLSGGNSFSGNQSLSGNFSATGLVSGATAGFSGSNSSQILNVAQNGTGWGIFSTNAAPLAAAIYGTSSNASGVGVQGFNTAATGGYAMSAATNSTSGIALFAAAGASTGTSLGIQAQTNSPTGTALFAVNSAGGTAGNFVGSVKVAGNTSVSGNLSSTGQLISTVATGTAPFSVNSTTQIANLNASLLGGQPASAFATTGANTFSGNQTVNGNLSATGVVTGSSFQIGSNLFDYGSYGSQDAFLGFAGNGTIAGNGNTASGFAALGSTNNSGSYNTADGFAALSSNTTGTQNIASGENALTNNTTGFGNAASGEWALEFNTTGSLNTASGALSGYSQDGSNITGWTNTFIGYLSTMATGTLNNATAIGAYSDVAESNAMVLGSINGLDGCGPPFNTCDSTLVGIGTTAPTYLLHIGNQGGVSHNNFLRIDGPSTGSGNAISIGGHGDFAIDAVNVAGGRFVVKDNGIVAIGIPNPLINPFQIKQGLGHAIADGWDTYSSRRWKTNIHPLTDALGKVERLRGVSYDLKASGKHEIGVIAEEVGEVVPEVVSYEENAKDARGVDYSRLTALLIEAVKQQETQIAAQQSQLREQQRLASAQQQEIRAQHRQIAAEQKRISALKQRATTLESTMTKLQQERKQVELASAK